jgi:hypothetical protein
MKAVLGLQLSEWCPYIPVYDIKGGWGGNGVGESGNGNSPVALLYRQKDNKNLVNKIFGNFFAEILFTDYLTLRSSFGIDNGSQFQKTINRKTYERSENQAQTGSTGTGFYFYQLDLEQYTYFPESIRLPITM